MTHHRRRRRRRCAIARAIVPIAAIVSCSVEVASGVNYVWNVASGTPGIWNATGNWTPTGTPAVNHTASFVNAGTFTTQLVGTHAADALTVSDGTVNLLSGTSAVRALNLTSNAADLTVSGGSLDVGGVGAATIAPVALTVGDAISVAAAGSVGTLTFDDAGTTLATSNLSAVHTIGANGGVATLAFRNGAVGDIGGVVHLANATAPATRATIHVEAGARLDLDTIHVATLAGGAQGTVNVGGVGSQLLISKALVLGHAGLVGDGGSATLNLTAGGVVTLSNVGHTINATGRIVQSGGNFNGGAGISVVGGRVDVTGGTFSFGTTATLSAGAVANLAGTTTSDGGSITLSGNGTQLNSVGHLSINGGSVSYGASTSGSLGTLTVGAGSGPASSLNVNATAALTVANAITVNAATLSVAGTLTQTGNAGLAVAGTQNIFGDVTLGSGGVLTTNGLATIGPRGRVTLGGDARWNAKASINVDAGQLNASAGRVTFAPSTTLSITNGGAATIGALEATTLAVSVAGTNSSLAASGTLEAASSLTIANGAVATIGALTLDRSTATIGGNGAASRADVAGTLAVIGPTAGVVVGNSATLNLVGTTPTLRVDNGAIVRELGGRVTVVAGARLDVDRAGQLLLDGGELILPANATIAVGSDAVVRVAESLLLTNDSTTTVAAGSLRARRVDVNNASLTVSGAGTLAFTDETAINRLGATPNNRAPIEVRDRAIATFAGDLIIGAAGQPNVNLASGGQVRVPTADLTIGASADSAPIVALQGLETTLEATLGDVTLGGRSDVRVLGGATLRAGGALGMGRHASLTLDGGTIRAGELTTPLAGTGRLNWVRGQLLLDRDLALSPDDLFGGSIDLGVGKTLRVAQTFSTIGNATITLSGGELDVNEFIDLSALAWTAGTLRVGRSATLGTTPIAQRIGQARTLNAGQTLVVAGTLNVANGGQLVLAGGSANASAVTVSAGGEVVLNSIAGRLDGPLNNLGLIRGEGSIGGSLANGATGEVRVESDRRLRLERATSNAGRLVLAGGTLESLATITNASAGDITGRGTLIAPAILNAGDLVFSSGITDVHGDLTNQTGGRVTVSGNADVSFWDDVTNLSGGSVRVSAGSSATFFGTYAGGGIGGTGAVYFESDVTPGFSPARVSLGGSASFAPTARLVMELGGLAPGTQHDQLAIAGLASLDGSLDVVAIDGFQPLPGDAFVLMTYAAHEGQLDARLLDNRFAGLDVIVTYTPTQLVLRATGLAGDADLDADVDFDDLLTLARHYNRSGTTWFTADFDRDGATDFDDLLALARNYNRLASADAAERFASDWPLAQSLVPEPALIGMTGVMTLACRRRGRRLRSRR